MSVRQDTTIFHNGLRNYTVMNEGYVIYIHSDCVYVLSFEPNDIHPTNNGPIRDVEILKDFGDLVDIDNESENNEDL